MPGGRAPIWGVTPGCFWRRPHLGALAGIARALLGSFAGVGSTGLGGGWCQACAPARHFKSQSRPRLLPNGRAGGPSPYRE